MADRCITRRGAVRLGVCAAAGVLAAVATSSPVTVAYAESAGDRVELVDGSGYYAAVGGTNTAVEGTGNLVWCCEPAIHGQKGSAVVRELIGSSSLRRRNINAEVVLSETHTWTQDDVTTIALVYKWVFENHSWWTDELRSTVFQRLLWGYVDAGFDFNLIKQTAFINGSAVTDAGGYTQHMITDAEANDLMSYVSSNRSVWIGHGLMYDRGDGNQKSIRVWAEYARGRAKLQKQPSHTDWAA